MTAIAPLAVGVAIAAPAFAILAGGFLATFRTPSLAMRSIVRHFTAGVMFAAAAAEALPDLLHTRGAASAAMVAWSLASRSALRRWSRFARSPTG